MKLSLTMSAKAFFQSSGTAFGQRRYINEVLSKAYEIAPRALFDTATLADEGVLSTHSKRENNIKSILCLARYLGLVVPVKKDVYRFSKEGKDYVSSNFSKDILIRKLSVWEPMRLFLIFVNNNFKCYLEDVVGRLGRQQKENLEVLSKAGLTKGGYSKPLNTHIIPNVLFELAHDAGLLAGQKNGPYRLTKDGSNLATDLSRRLDHFVWTRAVSREEIEPIIFSSIIEISSSNDIALATPWLDAQILDKVVNAGGFENREVHLICRKDNENNEECIEILKSVCNLEVKYTPSKTPLHSKIYMSDNGGLITSANFLHNSLMRNYEVGMMSYDPMRREDLRYAFAEMWEWGRKASV